MGFSPLGSIIMSPSLPPVRSNLDSDVGYCVVGDVNKLHVKMLERGPETLDYLGDIVYCISISWLKLQIGLDIRR